MKKRETSKLKKVENQLELIDTTNEMIAISVKGKDSLAIRQYEHLKKQYIKNLMKMLAEDYQIEFALPEAKAA